MLRNKFHYNYNTSLILGNNYTIFLYNTWDPIWDLYLFLNNNYYSNILI